MFNFLVCTLAVATAYDRLGMVKEINNAGAAWVAGPTRFWGDDGVNMTNLLGAGDNHVELQAAIARGDVAMMHADPDLQIPTDFDSETNWPACAKIIDDIRDQSNCGCCWAFGPSSAASDRFCIATGGSELVTFSAENTCFCSSRDGCGGGFTGSAWSHINNGVVSGGQYENTGPISDLCQAFSLPHCHHHGPQGSDPYPAEGQPGCPSERSPRCHKKCDSDAKAPHNDFEGDKYSFEGKITSYSSIDAIQQAIMTGGPIATAFTVYEDFENYVSGIYHHVSGGEAGGHAVRIVGWGVEDGTKYWKVANSWNPYWGEKGYFRIVRGTNEGNIEKQGIASADDAKWTSPHASYA